MPPKKESVFVVPYFKIAEEMRQKYGEKTVLLMESGKFYEILGLRDKNGVVDNVFMDITDLCCLGADGERHTTYNDCDVMVTGFHPEQFDKYLRRMIDERYTVVVYAQTKNEKGEISRHLDKIYSKGTACIESRNCEKGSNKCMCVWIERGSTENPSGGTLDIAAACIDVMCGNSAVFEYRVSESKEQVTAYDALEKFVSVYEPSEVIVVSNINAPEKVAQIIGLRFTASVSYKTIESVKKCQRASYQNEILRRVYPEYEIGSFRKTYLTTTQNSLAPVFCFLLDFVYEHNPKLLTSIVPPIIENLYGKLVLANHCLKQLNIINDGRGRGKWRSISEMLNECVTPMGRRKFEYLLLNPISNGEKLREIYADTVGVLNTNYENVRGVLKQIKDIAHLSCLIVRGTISPLQMGFLYHSLRHYVRVSAETPLRGLSEVAEILVEIESTLNIDKIGNDVDYVQPFVNSELNKLTNSFKETWQKICDLQTQYNDCLKLDTAVKWHEGIGLVATETRCKSLGVKYHKQGEKCVVYTDGLSESAIELSEKIVEKVNEVFAQFVSLMAKYKPKLDEISEEIAELDVRMTRAHLVRKYNLCCPEILAPPIGGICAGRSSIDISGLRHPIIEQTNTSEIYVANDIALGGGDVESPPHNKKEGGVTGSACASALTAVPSKVHLGSPCGMLLYGTNMVGKTSLIRALGIAVVMAQAGLFVFAQKMVFVPYTQLFTRILGDDNIHDGLSTFAVEMSELNVILRRADANSLILGDELCSGTETISAICIFVQGIVELKKQGATFVFATHLQEVRNMQELTNVAIKHMSVVYDSARDCLVYNRKLLDGAGKFSVYGLEVCKYLGLPPEFIEGANQIRSEHFPETNGTLAQDCTRYNSKKVRTAVCEKCGIAVTTEIHHMESQKNADENGFIVREDGTSFHKNHPANLMCLCEKCHLMVHDGGIIEKRVMTTKGYSVLT